MVVMRQTISILSKTLNIGIGYYCGCIIIYIVSLIMLIVKGKKKPFIIAFLFSYIFFLLASTVLSRAINETSSYNMELLWKYREVVHSPKGSNGLYIEILLNIAMMIPIGVIIPISSKKKAFFTFLVGLMISVGIELLQLVMHRGLCELNDIINNLFGVAIGYALFILKQKLFFTQMKKDDSTNPNFF